MSYTADLAHGLAGYLAAAGIGAYRPGGVYREDEVGIVIGTVPASPGRVVTLSVYPLVDDVDQADSLLGLQVRVRSGTPDPREVLDLLDAVFEILQGTTHLYFHDVEVHLSQRIASLPMRQDSNKRYEHADIYQLTTHRPTYHRRDN
ncbi:minor capsid protein [Actinocrispum wychmicini]|uniref:Tail terminator n=1 Tax=Actinocrispum wychmicini TaxID=1213861 RepID=A0A4R2K3K5_9PSEU|nr:minor capsid protein [Actinocrispum wychmicini]TCO64386.1 hypothetical protein EV192_101154 [Actinocrispum wychmicini]